MSINLMAAKEERGKDGTGFPGTLDIIRQVKYSFDLLSGNLLYHGHSGVSGPFTDRYLPSF
ncbi:hypothetical protein GCM10027299_57790 [Larkinella ripae]